MKILKEDYSKLLHQKIIKAEIPHIGKTTPSNEEIKKHLAKLTNANEELIVIKQIKTQFGLGHSIVKAYIYDSKEDLNNIEPKISAKKPKEEKPKA